MSIYPQSHVVNQVLLPKTPKEEERAFKDRINRLSAYTRWLIDTESGWPVPDLVAYQQYLLNERQLSKTSVNAHLYTIRNRYRELLREGTLRQAVVQTLPNDLDPAQRQTILDDTMYQIRAAVETPDAILTTERPQVMYRRLKAEHIRQLLNHPQLEDFVGKRDAAIFTLLFTTGLRNNELCALRIEDLTTPDDDQLALHVPDGPGCTERIIPYGKLVWGLNRTQDWLHTALGISPEPSDTVFQAVYKVSRKQGQAKRTLRPGGLSPRSLDHIFDAYPIEMEGQPVILTPMDLRRAHARLLFEAGYELETIKQRLGLSDNNALMEYIGGSEAGLDLPSIVDPLSESTWLNDSLC